VDVETCFERVAVKIEKSGQYGGEYVKDDFGL